MRNEQSAGYAAQAASYLTGRTQACLVVSGPGVIHAFAGLANAKENCWPMILIGGASPTYQNGMGAFQEERQTELAAPYCKYAHNIEHVERIPYYVEQAIRTSVSGRSSAGSDFRNAPPSANGLVKCPLPSRRHCHPALRYCASPRGVSPIVSRRLEW